MSKRARVDRLTFCAVGAERRAFADGGRHCRERGLLCRRLADAASQAVRGRPTMSGTLAGGRSWPFVNGRNLQDEVVLITGGAGGLGAQLAVQAAMLGAHVVIWDRSEADMSRVGACQSGSVGPVEC
jgi:hypothetical protein